MSKVVPYFSLFICVLSVFAVAQTPQDTPAATVSEYCSLDFNGMRLTSKGAGEISRLTMQKHQPGWDSVIVTREYRIGKSSLNGQSASVEVRYSNFGALEETQLKRTKEPETVTFALKKINNRWIITSRLMAPHVSRESMIKHYQVLARDEDNAQEARSALSLLRSLK